MATLILAALYMPWISTSGAKFGLFFGLAFYVLLQHILQVNLHFVHIWGLEFVLNVALMSFISYFQRQTQLCHQRSGFC